MYDHHEECRVAERVTKGVEFLDENRPNWRNEVDQGILDLASSSACVVGQIGQTGLFSDGLDTLGLSQGDARDLGFEVLSSDWGESPDGYNMNAEYSALTEEWIRVLTAPQDDGLTEYRVFNFGQGEHEREYFDQVGVVRSTSAHRAAVEFGNLPTTVGGPYLFVPEEQDRDAFKYMVVVTTTPERVVPGKREVRVI